MNPKQRELLLRLKNAGYYATWWRHPKTGKLARIYLEKPGVARHFGGGKCWIEFYDPDKLIRPRLRGYERDQTLAANLQLFVGAEKIAKQMGTDLPPPPREKKLPKPPVEAQLLDAKEFNRRRALTERLEREERRRRLYGNPNA